MKKFLIGAAATAGIVTFALTAFAGQPENPGVFGTDRAAYIHDVALPDTSGPGASEVGKILASRAGDNGAINQAYKAAYGGDPTTP